jgi:hypothetical protein
MPAEIDADRKEMNACREATEAKAGIDADRKEMNACREATEAKAEIDADRKEMKACREEGGNFERGRGRRGAQGSP